MNIASKRAAEIYQAVKSVLKRYYDNNGNENEHAINVSDSNGEQSRFVKTTFHSKSKPTNASVELFDDLSDLIFMDIAVNRGHWNSNISNRCVKIQLMFEGNECFYNIINHEQSVIWIGIEHGEQQRSEVERLIDSLKRVALKYTDISPFVGPMPENEYDPGGEVSIIDG